ncbi:hypothetical protein ACHAQA_009969 [Verticillium albo-atrum]
MSHSHRSTTKVSHKPFKSKHATKGALRNAAKGKVAGTEKGQRKTPHQNVMSKFDRRNQAKQLRLTKQKEHLEGTSVFVGRDGAPRVVALVPLCEDSDVNFAIKQLNDSLDIEADIEENPFRVSVDRFKQKLQYVPLKRDLNAVLDGTRVADFVVVMLSAGVEVDPLGELMLRSLESQGMSTLFTVVQGMDKVEPAKQKQQVLGSLKSYITHFHPEQEKLYSLENRQECSNLMRSLCNTTPKGIRWRDERSWLLAEEIQFSSSDTASTVITGVVRGKGLKANRLVQLGDHGIFQIEKIMAAPISTNKKGEAMAVQDINAEEILEVPDEDQDELVDLAPDEAMEGDDAMDDGAMSVATTGKRGVLLDDHHYFDEDNPLDPTQQPKKVPKGTSNYQSAWYLGEDISDSGSDMEDFEMEDESSGSEEIGPEDGLEGYAPKPPTEGAPSEYPQSEMFQDLDDVEDAKQLAAFRKNRRVDDVEDDKEFPDEIELHPGVAARERLAKYRGLKSLRTSEWVEDEDRAYEPEDWRRLLRVPDYQGSRSRFTREALVGGVAPGTRVSVHLKAVPATFEKSYKPGQPVTLVSLLRHEQKKTVVNYLINLSSDYDKSIKSKEELIVQCGARRFTINPLFSHPGNTPNDVHKYCRYLHPGQSSVATFTGPVTWGAVPVLFFKRTTPSTEGEESDVGLTLIATGTALPPSTSRIVAKRVILTGHPYHINKKIVTIRYMFFNREDVEWFKALPLWTRRGRNGYVKEPLGTHGYFKATFDAPINPQDAVGVSLYKRVWPREAATYTGPLLGQEAQEPTAAAQDDMMIE